jgi:hypothetical protein
MTFCFWSQLKANLLVTVPKTLPLRALKRKQPRFGFRVEQFRLK